jgi:hypothetical protein
MSLLGPIFWMMVFAEALFVGYLSVRGCPIGRQSSTDLFALSLCSCFGHISFREERESSCERAS